MLQACEAQGIECAVVGFKGYTDQVQPHFLTRIGASGSIVKWLKAQDVEDIVFIGSVKRPTVLDLWPDWFTAKFFFNVWRNSLGDSGLLSAARKTLEEQGFQLHGVHKFLPEILMLEGVLGAVGRQDRVLLDIQLGLKSSQELGAQDIGQAVIVKDGSVIGLEDKHGTSALIKKHGVAGAILVKTCKPQQDVDLDLPTIGPETAQLCADVGMAGIVGQAGHTIIVDLAEVISIADKNDLFVLGVTIDA